MPQFTSHSGSSEGKDICSASQTRLASQVLNSNALHSWIYPQSTIPPSLISVLISAAADGGLFNKICVKFPLQSFLFVHRQTNTCLKCSFSIYLFLFNWCCHLFSSWNGFLKKTTWGMGGIISKSLLYVPGECLSHILW